MRWRQRPPRWLAAVLVAALLAAGGAPAVGGAPLGQTATLQPGALATVANTGGEAVNVRERPGLQAPILGSLPEGTVVLVNAGPETADGYRWWQVTSQSLGTGWMVENFLAAAVNPQATAPAATPTPRAAEPAAPVGAMPTPLVTVAPVGVTPIAAPVVGPAGAPAAAAPPTATPVVVRGGTLAIGGRAVVVVGPGEALNVRAQASTSAPLAGTAADGTIVTIVDGPVTAEGMRWWLVTYSGVTGFVVESFIAPIR